MYTENDLLLQQNEPSSTASVAPSSATPSVTQTFGVSDTQRDDAYAQWLQAGSTEGLAGMYQYQWTQNNNLTGVTGLVIQPTVLGTAETPIATGTGVTPNDGYNIQGQGQTGAVCVLSEAQQSFGSGAT